VFACPPVAHVRPVLRFLIPGGLKIPLAMRNACLGRIWRAFHFGFLGQNPVCSEYYSGAG